MSPPPTNPNTSCQLIRGEEKTPATADTNHHQIHNTTPTNFFFQRFTITKIIIKNPCTNKKNHAVWLVCTPAKDPKWESSLKHADAGKIQKRERSAQIWNNQMNEERNIVLRFKPYSLLASLITRTINQVATDT